MYSVWDEAVYSTGIYNDQNQVFNPHFIFANDNNDFAAGWQKYMGSKTANISWEKGHKEYNSIKIQNHLAHRMASICQQRPYRIAIYEKQVWEIGAQFKSDIHLSATIRVHFQINNTRSIYTRLDFLLEPGSNYYYGLVLIPGSAEYAWVEAGTPEVGTLWIENVVFKRVFPIEKLDMDGRGRLNLGTVEAIQRIVEPVKLAGSLKLTRETRDVFEDITATPIKQTSRIQDVLNLNVYSFCVLNRGDAVAMVRMQLSPDGVNFMDAPMADELLEPGQMKVLTYNYFLKFNRLLCWTNNGETTNLRVYFQGQG